MPTNNTFECTVGHRGRPVLAGGGGMRGPRLNGQRARPLNSIISRHRYGLYDKEATVHRYEYLA